MLISVIIPVHNSEQYIEDCVKSIVFQGKKLKKEIILIENGSTDNSYAKCKKIQETYGDDLIRVIRSEYPNVGNARNIGIDICNGEYIHFVDSDDTLSKSMYDDMSEYLQEQYDLVTTGIINCYINQNKKVIEKSQKRIICNTPGDICIFLKKITFEEKTWALNVVWNRFFKTSIIKDNHIRFREDITLGEDFVFNCEYIQNIENMVIENRAYYRYMHREQVSLVNKFRKDTSYRRPIVYSAYCNLYRHFGCYEEKKLDLELLEGKLTFGALYGIFSNDAKLSESEALSYVQELCEANHFDHAKKYLAHGNMYNKLALHLIKKKQYKLLIKLLSLKHKIRH